MNVKWEDVKADFARKDAEIEKLKTMNAELVEALEVSISAIDTRFVSAQKLSTVKSVLSKAKELNQ
jgi:hypothetical protein